MPVGLGVGVVSSGSAGRGVGAGLYVEEGVGEVAEGVQLVTTTRLVTRMDTT